MLSFPSFLKFVYIPHIWEGEGLISTRPRGWHNIIPLQVPTFFRVHLIGLFVSLQELSFWVQSSVILFYMPISTNVSSVKYQIDALTVWLDYQIALVESSKPYWHYHTVFPRNIICMNGTQSEFPKLFFPSPHIIYIWW